jgi:hypothetical protein
MTPEISSQIDSPNIRWAVPAAGGILIGGGPAGATAAYHPGFRVGQSLPPAWSDAFGDSDGFGDSDASGETGRG